MNPLLIFALLSILSLKQARQEKSDGDASQDFIAGFYSTEDPPTNFQSTETSVASNGQSSLPERAKQSPSVSGFLDSWIKGVPKCMLKEPEEVTVPDFPKPAPPNPLHPSLVKTCEEIPQKPKKRILRKKLRVVRKPEQPATSNTEKIIVNVQERNSAVNSNLPVGMKEKIQENILNTILPKVEKPSISNSPKSKPIVVKVNNVKSVAVKENDASHIISPLDKTSVSGALESNSFQSSNIHDSNVIAERKQFDNPNINPMTSVNNKEIISSPPLTNEKLTNNQNGNNSKEKSDSLSLQEKDKMVQLTTVPKSIDSKSAIASSLQVKKELKKILAAKSISGKYQSGGVKNQSKTNTLNETNPSPFDNTHYLPKSFIDLSTAASMLPSPSYKPTEGLHHSCPENCLCFMCKSHPPTQITKNVSIGMSQAIPQYIRSTKPICKLPYLEQELSKLQYMHDRESQEIQSKSDAEFLESKEFGFMPILKSFVLSLSRIISSATAKSVALHDKKILKAECEILKHALPQTFVDTIIARQTMTVTTAYSVTIPKVIQCLTFETRTATVLSMLPQTITACPTGFGGGDTGERKDCVLLSYKKVPCSVETYADRFYVGKKTEPCETRVVDNNMMQGMDSAAIAIPTAEVLMRQ